MLTAWNVARKTPGVARDLADISDGHLFVDYGIRVQPLVTTDVEVAPHDLVVSEGVFTHNIQLDAVVVGYNSEWYY